MDQNAESQPYLAQHVVGVGWVLVAILSLLEVFIVLAYSGEIRWVDAVWYQLAAGALLTISGGMIAGWGIATFVASSKGSPPQASAYEIRPQAQDQPSTTALKPPCRPTQVPSLGMRLDEVSGIGPVRASKAKDIGIETLADVVTASPDELAALRKAIGNSTVYEAVILQARNAEAAERGRQP